MMPWTEFATMAPQRPPLEELIEMVKGLIVRYMDTWFHIFECAAKYKGNV